MKRIGVGEVSQEILKKLTSGLGNLYQLEPIRDFEKISGLELLILDATTQPEDSFKICEKTKHHLSVTDLPVVIFTDDSPEMIAAGFTSGADDCIFAGATIQEIRVRIKARLRDTAKLRGHTSYAGGQICLDTIKQRVVYREKDGSENSFDMTPHEFRLFTCLMARESKIISRAELMSTAWERNVNVLPRTVDKHISSLREKAKAICRIESVRSNGYILTLDRHFHDRTLHNKDLDL